MPAFNLVSSPCLYYKLSKNDKNNWGKKIHSMGEVYLFIYLSIIFFLKISFSYRLSYLLNIPELN